MQYSFEQAVQISTWKIHYLTIEAAVNGFYVDVKYRDFMKAF